MQGCARSWGMNWIRKGGMYFRIQIVHASDMEKRDSENKRERRRQSRESAVRRLEKKLLENGYESLEEYSTDRRYADKWLGPERIQLLLVKSGTGKLFGRYHERI